MTPPSIVWFRQDLRLHDQPALVAAAHGHQPADTGIGAKHVLHHQDIRRLAHARFPNDQHKLVVVPRLERDQTPGQEHAVVILARPVW